MRIFRTEGQTLVMSVLFLTVVLGMAAVVLDLGSWYRAQRATQAAADAAALAAAQALPESESDAISLAYAYRDKNDVRPEDDRKADVTRAEVTNANFDDDTITVELERPAPGFFSQLFGIDSVTVRARAAARVAGVRAATYVAPFAVDKAHPLLSGTLNGEDCPCFGVTTVLDLEKVGPGAFRIMNIDGSRGGTGQDILADWIRHGLDAKMEKDAWYYSDSGAKFNASEVKAAMTDRVAEELLFPVYTEVREGGSNAEYFVIGWVGFHVDSFEPKGNGGQIHGHFTKFVAQGFQASTGQNPNTGNNFGTRSVALVE